MRKILIYGAGGFGREVYDTISKNNEKDSEYIVKGFVDDAHSSGTVINGLEVIGGEEVLAGLDLSFDVVLAISDPVGRKRLFDKYSDRFEFRSIIHPNSEISKYAQIGRGCIIQSFCIVAANSQIGDSVIMNAHSGVGHDANVHSYVSIMSYCDVAGNAEVGPLTFIGTGARILPNIYVSQESYLCAGTVLMKNLISPSKVIGNPGKII